MSNSPKISDLLAARIEADDFASAVYLVAGNGEIKFSGALGLAVAEPETIAAEFETIYDLASLTKPLVTGLLCAQAVQNGEIDLDLVIATYLPQFQETDKAAITIRQLLTHTSGLMAWRPFYLLEKRDGVSRKEKLAGVIDAIISAPFSEPPDTKVIYSDLNFLILTALLEEIYGKSLDQIAAERIFTPLDLKKTFYNPPAELKMSIAASERGNGYERETAEKEGYAVSDFPWRDNVVWGEVHDGNAYFLNGVSGHAGIFSTAHETLKIAHQFLPRYSQILNAETCKQFTKNFTPGLNEARSFAFQLAATELSTAGEALAKNSFGHLGFTGTSLWIEPDKERVFILLTNRTHAHELPFMNINSVRREFHRLATEELNGAQIDK